MGEQKALVLAASQERAGGGLRLPHHRGPWTQSTSAPGPLAGSDVNRLPASVLPLHHKYPLSRHGHQQRVFSKDHWREGTPSPTREREGSTELVGYNGLHRVTRTGGIRSQRHSVVQGTRAPLCALPSRAFSSFRCRGESQRDQGPQGGWWEVRRWTFFFFFPLRREASGNNPPHHHQQGQGLRLT